MKHVFFLCMCIWFWQKEVLRSLIPRVIFGNKLNVVDTYFLNDHFSKFFLIDKLHDKDWEINGKIYETTW